MNSTPGLREMLSALVAAPSVSSADPALDQSNAGVIDLLAGWLAEFGFALERIESSPGKFNLIATLGSGPGGLVLAGHTDTVPFNAERWQQDPLRLRDADNCWYGMGTADMKGFFPLVIEALRNLRAKDLKAPLIVLATADEETSMQGARTLQALGRPRARHAVIGEPTSLRPVRMHKGILMESLRLIGQSGHSSNPALGRNALDGMYQLMGALMHWREDLARRHQNPLFEVTYPTLNLGHIHGGDNPNRICGDCELHIDLRPLPGMEIAELREELYAVARQSMSDTGLQLECRSLFPGNPAYETPDTAPLVKAAESLTGHAAEAVAFGTEAPFLQALGMDTIVLGPGDISCAHQPEEHLRLDRIKPTVSILQDLIRRFCIDLEPAP
ncbi:acetylornithine deacetylase [Thermithiobacillus plumbiphilus]|uniref:Acetylornithine deacetylase n=1 Tax=Thermithiobacillus plumbiphilus TaxID=1729899 RepID=A0ABU9D7N0_9PROT